jgi:hypothetical protein
MTDITFAYMATVTASTKRGNMTTGFTLYLSGLKCFPLAPVDAETRKRMDLNTPHVVFQTFLQDAPDIKKGDLLVIDAVEYPVKSVEPWPFFGENRLQLVIEDLRN